MAFSRSISRIGTRREDWTENAPYVAGVIAAAGTLVLSVSAPANLVLPALSVLLLGLAFVLAVVVRGRSGRHGQAGWYVSAALTFIGFGAALLTDPEQVLPLLEGARREP